MNIKNKDFVAYSTISISNKHKICSGRELVWPKSALFGA